MERRPDLGRKRLHEEEAGTGTVSKKKKKKKNKNKDKRDRRGNRAGRNHPRLYRALENPELRVHRRPPASHWDTPKQKTGSEMAGEGGRFYSVAEKEAWDSMTILKGQILETEVAVSEDPAEGEAVCAFLVQKVLLSVTGDLLLVAKSLGSPNAAVGKAMSLAFNRRRGAIHLCGGHCGVLDSHPLHVGAVTVYEAGDYDAEFVSGYAKKNMAKWLEEDVSPVGEEGKDFLDIDGQPMSSGEEVAGEDSKEALAKRPRVGPAAGKAAAPRVRERVGTPVEPKAPALTGVDREALRERLASLRERLTGTPRSGGAALSCRPLRRQAIHPRRGTPGRGHSASPWQREDGARKRGFQQGPKEPRGHREGVGMLEASKGTTMSTLQRQLVQRATDTAVKKAEERRAEKKRHRKRDPSAQLLKILTKKSRSSRRGDKSDEEKKKKKKKKRKGRKKRQDGWPSGPENPDQSSSPTSSYGASSSGNSEEESSSERIMDAPLKEQRKARLGVGAVGRARAPAAGPDKQGFGAPDSNKPHQGGEVVQLLQHSGAASAGAGDRAGAGDASPRKWHRPAAAGGARCVGGPLGQPLHERAPSPPGWGMEHCSPHGTHAPRGVCGSRKRHCASSSQTRKDDGETAESGVLDRIQP